MPDYESKDGRINRTSVLVSGRDLVDLEDRPTVEHASGTLLVDGTFEENEG